MKRGQLACWVIPPSLQQRELKQCSAVDLLNGFRLQVMMISPIGAVRSNLYITLHKTQMT